MSDPGHRVFQRLFRFARSPTSDYGLLRGAPVRIRSAPPIRSGIDHGATVARVKVPIHRPCGWCPR